MEISSVPTRIEDWGRAMKRIKSIQRAGFSLIELMAVLAIIAVLLCLMLPGVASSREAARRTQCVNSLRQISLALTNYEGQQGSLPPGVINPSGPITTPPGLDDLHRSWLVGLLPYMEQSGVYGAVDSDYSVYEPENDRASQTIISTFICPSDMKRRLIDGRAVGSYAGCHHETEAPIDVDNHGVFYLNSHIRHEDITDGSGMTIFVGEKLVVPPDLGWMSGTRATLRNTGTVPNGIPTGGVQDGKFVGGFASQHPGGSNFAFGDGSVRFVREEINLEIYRRLGHREDGELIDERSF